MGHQCDTTQPPHLHGGVAQKACPVLIRASYEARVAIWRMIGVPSMQLDWKKTGVQGYNFVARTVGLRRRSDPARLNVGLLWGDFAAS
jgi:hypothetical protein